MIFLWAEIRTYNDKSHVDQRAINLPALIENSDVNRFHHNVFSFFTKM